MTKFKIRYLDKEATLTEYVVRTYSEHSLVSALNREGFALGNGHDESEMVWVSENKAVLTCIPYVGSPSQTIYFELKTD